MPDRPHRRFNPLSGEWVLVSPGRMQRPWDGGRDRTVDGELPGYEPDCYLCPGNRRVGGQTNPNYASTFVFTNDYPALTDEPDVPGNGDQALFRHRAVRGTSRVICYSPAHNRTLPLLPESDILSVVDCWTQQVDELGAQFPWVQVFENKGEIMGCSNPHPHGQIWAQSELPTQAAREDRRLAEYHRKHGSNLLLDYAETELAKRARIVETNDTWAAIVPYWATWPYETLLLPLEPVMHLDALDERQKRSLAAVLKRLLSRYDNLFECSFPYSMGWHGRPFDGESNEHWQLHAHFFPPLLRSARIRKFMVGYEMLAESQRDLLPELAAERLRALSSVHFRER
jgi:UDPglucose--hexose-1-phosphate uridylyltransferase